MTPRATKTPPDWACDALEALKRAARAARERARQTGTYLVVSRNGRVVYLDPVTMQEVKPSASRDRRV